MSKFFEQQKELYQAYNKGLLDATEYKHLIREKEFEEKMEKLRSFKYEIMSPKDAPDYYEHTKTN